jgi:hypothetical protein
MKGSKDLFLMMREEEVATSNFLPTKKELHKSAKDFAMKLIDGGDFNMEETYAQALRLKEALTIIEGVLKSSLKQENFEAFGLVGNYRGGGNTVNYKEDEIYNVLKTDLDNRVELLKLAQKQDVLDTGGNEVPKVSTTPRKSSLAISF